MFLKYMYNVVGFAFSRSTICVTNRKIIDFVSENMP